MKSFTLNLIKFFYKTLISPRLNTEDLRRKEYLLNIILTCLVFLSIVGCTLVLFAQIEEGSYYTGLGLFSTMLVLVFFCLQIYLSRSGNLLIPSYSLLIILFSFSLYSAYSWGADLPSSLLSFSLLIVISSVLISTRFSIYILLLTSVVIITLSYFEIKGVYVPDRSWEDMDYKIDDAIEYVVLISTIMAVSFLSNKETEKSLERARNSEAALQEERDGLEIKIEERTNQLRIAQIEKVTEMYRFVEFGRLASGLFHDLSSPLNAISMSVENFCKDNKNIKDISVYTNIAVNSSRRINELLIHAKKQLVTQDTQVIFDVRNEIRLVIDFLTSKIRKNNVNISLLCFETLSVYGNPVIFSHILTNLISNAVDSYSNITDTRNRLIEVRAMYFNDNIEISVKDFGCGIPQDILPFIFQPFYTTKKYDDGMGIGLSATKHVLEKYFNGKILVSSVTNVGSNFTIIIDRKNTPTVDSLPSSVPIYGSH